MKLCWGAFIAGWKLFPIARGTPWKTGVYAIFVSPAGARTNAKVGNESSSFSERQSLWALTVFLAARGEAPNNWKTNCWKNSSSSRTILKKELQWASWWRFLWVCGEGFDQRVGNEVEPVDGNRKMSQAADFLKWKVRGQKVFLSNFKWLV